MLAHLLLRLPPILYINHRNPILSYSKAPWGLSVLSQVTGIFTGTTISPGGQLRQCPDGTGQVSAPILHLSIWQRPVFLLNSRLGLFSAAHLREHPFSLSYGVNLPSSLTTLLPLALESSSYLPVSVCGTGILNIHTTFLALFQVYFPTIFSVPYARVYQRPGYTLLRCPCA